ncbi:hypothetical protein B9Z55_027168 [Caenorhabditis nigoni]|uniref:Uncharacterized protein n=1 Tax=Caenorhabditis nigoni TaxID=1611254 RepID=A0A2G5SGX8_9PELO|nr:hypothetical protein B9Z55_027168 [Caenorhabditis nigoni]
MSQIALQGRNGLLESPFVSTSTISTLNSIQFEVDIELTSPEPALETTTPVEAEVHEAKAVADGQKVEEPKRKILEYDIILGDDWRVKDVDAEKLRKTATQPIALAFTPRITETSGLEL